MRICPLFWTTLGLLKTEFSAMILCNIFPTDVYVQGGRSYTYPSTTPPGQASMTSFTTPLSSWFFV